MVLPVIAAIGRAAASGAVRGASASARGTSTAAKGSAQNARTVVRGAPAGNSASATQNASTLTRNITRDFLEGKSLSAKVRRATTIGKRERREDDEKREKNFFDETSSRIQNWDQQLLQNAFGGPSEGEARAMANSLSNGAHMAKKKLGGTLLFSIAGTCSFWQFVFGIMAILFIVGGHYDIAFGLTGDAVAEFLSGTAGTVVESAANFIGFFFGFHIDLPPVTFSAIGGFMWGINLAILLAGYGAILTMLFFTNKELLGRTGIQLTLFCCVAGDFIFGLQIFPWMLVFATVVWIESRSPASLLHRE